MNPSNRRNQGRRLIAILVQTVEIGIILMLAAGIFLLWQRLQQSTQQMTALQATLDTSETERLHLSNQLTAVAAPTATETAATEDDDVVSFSDPNNPASLNPALVWHPGNAPANAYDVTLEPGTLTLIAGPGTDQWQSASTGPVIVLPVSGDFDVSVKVKASLFEAFQRVGLGVRSTQDVNTWVNISRNYHSGIAGAHGIAVMADQRGSSSMLNNIPYTGETIFFKIERRGSELDLYYSEDGTNWNVLQENYVAEYADPVEVFLMASSTSAQGITVQFSEFTLSPLP